MTKQLRFEIKQNLRKPARVYVKSPDLKTIFGSFTLADPDSFDSWQDLNSAQKVELRLYIDNLSAINKHIKPEINDPLADIRLRVPASFVDGLTELTDICINNNVEMDIFDPVITSIIQKMKISTAKLEGDDKSKALQILDRLKIADFKSQDHKPQIQAIFNELNGIYNRSEKLHKRTIELHNKDKSYSPRAIKGMGAGETTPAKWLVSCAIDILIDEKPEILKSMLTPDDIKMLYIRPLLKAKSSKEFLLGRLEQLNCDEINNIALEQTQTLN